MGKGHNAQNSNLILPNQEIIYIFNEYIHAVTERFITQTAKKLDRTPDAVKRVWGRICHDGSAYAYEREYNFLRPCSDKPYFRINRYAKQYLALQFYDPQIQATSQTLSFRTGIPEKMIRRELAKTRNPFKTKKRDRLEFEILEYCGDPHGR